MTEYEGFGELLLQADEQVEQGVTLRLGTCVGSLSVRVQATLVANADGVGVVEFAVGTDLFQRSAYIQFPVTFNVIMVPNILEFALLDMVFLTVLESEALSFRCSRTV